jgi:hypothetical protein
MKRYRILLNRFRGYGYTIPPQIVAYRFTEGAARRLTAHLNDGAQTPLYYYERNK